ncbi:MAG: ATP-binding protein [Clostridia bacterium]|nr:ATP-binding protein [Clostridia bacterium]
MNLSELQKRLFSLSVFRRLLDDEVLECLLLYLSQVGGDELACVSAYSELVSRLYSVGGNLTEYVKTLVYNDENVYIRTVGSGKTPDENLSRAVKEELITLSAVASLTPDELIGNGPDYLPKFSSQRVDLEAAYLERAENIGKYGYGIYAKHRMFYLSDDGKITPVYHPDPVALSSLVDYEREQKIILDNTRALLSGKPAANILLTGDAGTGKSSTVKAIVNELWNEGLRILEVRKEQLHSIPALLDELNANPLKFILFIDDLSFGKDDDNYSALKAILEGSVSAKSQNVAIYATSNRRHLVKESFADREGDDIHFNDTLQEILSLSDRFGIRITFRRPDKATYLDIVRSLAVQRGLDFEPQKLYQDAEQFALARGGRSPRAARQFVDSLQSTDGEGINIM